MNDQVNNSFVGGKDIRYEESFLISLKKKKIPLDPKTEALNIKEDLKWFEFQYDSYKLRYGECCTACVFYGAVIKSLKKRQYSLAKVL